MPSPWFEGLQPQHYTDNGTGAAVDLTDYPGPVLGTFHTGQVISDSFVAWSVQESADGLSGWVAIAGASLPASGTPNEVRTFVFDHAQPFVRVVMTLTGDDRDAFASAQLGVLNTLT